MALNGLKRQFKLKKNLHSNCFPSAHKGHVLNIYLIIVYFMDASYNLAFHAIKMCIPCNQNMHSMQSKYALEMQVHTTLYDLCNDYQFLFYAILLEYQWFLTWK